jgi:hypothetical protein
LRRVAVDVGTDHGDWQLSVLVSRDDAGRFAVATYPSLVGPVATSSEVEPTSLAPVTDTRLIATSKRVVTNYVERARDNLAADIAPGASVVLPGRRVALRAIGDIGWVDERRTVRVEATVRTRDRVLMTLTYDLRVIRRAGRWLVNGISSTSTPKEPTP